MVVTIVLIRKMWHSLNATDPMISLHVVIPRMVAYRLIEIYHDNSRPYQCWSRPHTLFSCKFIASNQIEPISG